jgi:hypothetical protein
MTIMLFTGALAFLAAVQADSNLLPKPTQQVDPYKRLFVTRPIDEVQTGKAKTALLKHSQPIPTQFRLERGPCNMPVVRANPDVDSRIIAPIAPGKHQAKIRVIEPTTCGEKHGK